MSFLQCSVSIGTSAGEPVEGWLQRYLSRNVPQSSVSVHHRTAGQKKFSPHLLAAPRIKNVPYKNKRSDHCNYMHEQTFNQKRLNKEILLQKCVKSAVQYDNEGGKKSELQSKSKHMHGNEILSSTFALFSISRRKVVLCSRENDYIPEDSFRVLSVLYTDSCYTPHYVTSHPQTRLQSGSATGAVEFLQHGNKFICIRDCGIIPFALRKPFRTLKIVTSNCNVWGQRSRC